jgi:hypothetical protein
MTTNAIDLNAPDIGTGAVVMTYEPPKPHRAAKPAVILRETDGRRQLVGYFGWKTILTRLANPRP